MNGDKKVSFALVGNGGALVELYELVGLAGENNLKVGVCLAHELTELKRYGERYILLLGVLSLRARVFAAMSGINDDCRKKVVGIRTLRRGTVYEKAHCADKKEGIGGGLEVEERRVSQHPLPIEIALPLPTKGGSLVNGAKIRLFFQLSLLRLGCLALGVVGGCGVAQAQPTEPPTRDTVVRVAESVGTLDAKITSHASDSMTYDLRRRTVSLQGKAKLVYKSQQFEAESIDIDLNERQLFARGVKDSTGKTTGDPIFTEGSDKYTMTDIRYNFITRKARITGVITTVQEGYLHGEVIKKMPNDVIYVGDGKFTTCDLKHPHFYLALTRAKVIPNDKIFTDLAYLVIADVPAPIGIPFGFFPNTSKRSSGIIPPEYGEEQARGFFLRNGGFYLGLNDYFDLTVLGGYYTRGSWDASLATNYKLRYKFSGRLGYAYSYIASGQENTPERSIHSNYRITWSHTQDRAWNPNSTFNANVTFGSSSYNRFNARNAQDFLSNQIMSSVAYSRSFPGKPFNLSVTLNHSQNSRDSIVDLRVPTVAFNVQRIYPFKRKNAVGAQRWYERIGVTYNTALQNSVRIKEQQLFTPEMQKRLKNGLQHRASASTSFTLLKHINLSPSVSYNENWYIRTTRYHWDAAQKKPVLDTVNGFARTWYYSTGLGLSTKLYGMYAFIPQSPIKAIRHVMTPSVSLSYHPDFSDPKYGMYGSVQKNEAGEAMRYSYFANTIYGGAPAGESGAISFSLGNNWEMKLRGKPKSPQDTAKVEDKKIPLLESLNFSSGYNFLADSMGWSPLSVSAHTNFLSFLNLSGNASFSPYSADENGRIFNEYYAKRHTWPVRFERVSMSASFSLNKVLGFKGDDLQTTYVSYLPGYIPYDRATGADFLVQRYDAFTAPWNVSVNYNFSYSKSGSRRSSLQSLSFSGSVTLAKDWQVSLYSGYDFVAEQFSTTSVSISRDLHCWNMSLNVVPFGQMRSYSFRIGVNSGVLNDLKYQKNKSYIDNLLR